MDDFNSTPSSREARPDCGPPPPPEASGFLAHKSFRRFLAAAQQPVPRAEEWPLPSVSPAAWAKLPLEAQRTIDGLVGSAVQFCGVDPKPETELERRERWANDVWMTISVRDRFALATCLQNYLARGVG